MWADAQRDGRPAICSVPAHGDGQTSCKFGWLPVSDVATVTKPRCETC